MTWPFIFMEVMFMEEKQKVIAEPEYEGDSRGTWWYVCSECHGAIDMYAKECPHCKAEIDWSWYNVKLK